jgi:hypothetical protein
MEINVAFVSMFEMTRLRVSTAILFRTGHVCYAQLYSPEWGYIGEGMWCKAEITEHRLKGYEETLKEGGKQLRRP